ncbi:Surfactin synthase thioesterase subunit [Pseudarcicella hirudinis]|uniref:Surfactin synthase thioesterase subunit n=1 Tax=Pseudarcicella hirudinis TaxID=1079859 RepID=A0A1I5TG80_9BACT|nr:alpha/beta fold hydrolase [Pseudarcicella hirudinis]SFP82035.1 Surfactin synthase thioesterase subunit [Pseudarcicella hirudinis]
MQKVRLFCLPFVGGSQFSYTPFRPYMPEGIHMISLDLPGHGTLFTEKPLDCLHQIADNLFERIEKYLDEPYGIFGHSMGSMVSFLLLHRIRESGYPMPVHVFLSGRGGACIHEKERGVHELPTEELLLKLEKMSGKSQNLASSPKALCLYEKVLRADLAALDFFEYEQFAGEKLDVNATILIGTHDLYTVKEASFWQKEFRPKIDLNIFEGGHFFIFDYLKEISEMMGEQLLSTSNKLILLENWSLGNRLA